MNLSYAKRRPIMCPDDTNANRLFQIGTSRILGRVARLELGWAGRLQLHLHTSVGDVVIKGNRDNISLDLEKGDWVRAHVSRPVNPGRRDVELVSIRVVKTVPNLETTAWLPTSLCHRENHLRRLRRMLTQLAPPLQVAFMVAMQDAQLQRRFFWRVGAADHHGYPGGLFDQSVCAGELAWAHSAPGDPLRGVATLAALLFDLGKAFDPVLARDKLRVLKPLAAHPMTAYRLRRAYDALVCLAPAMGEILKAVIETNPGSAVGGPPEVAALTERVRAAVRQSWCFE